MEISIWAFVSVVAAIPCALFLGWGAAGALVNRNWERRWAEQAKAYDRQTQSAFDTIRATSAEDKAKAESHRERSKVEIESLQAELSELAREDIESDMLLRAETTDSKLRSKLTVKTQDGKILEPLLPGDYI